MLQMSYCLESKDPTCSAPGTLRVSAYMDCVDGHRQASDGAEVARFLKPKPSS